MPITETDLLGRRIDQLMVVTGVPLAAATNTLLYTTGRSPNIIPSPTTGGCWIAYVSVLITAGNGATGQLGFGTTAGGFEWASASIFSSFVDSPAVFYPISAATSRPGKYGIGTTFYASCPAVGWTAGTLATIKLFGWTE